MFETTDASRARPTPNSAWLGVSSADAWGFELGYRYRYVGISIGSDDAAFGENIPAHEEIAIPHSSYRTERFDGGAWGINVYGFYDVTEWLAPFASVGFYWRAYQVLDRSLASQTYWKNPDSPEFRDGRFAVGAGARLTLFRHFVIGGGYNLVAGPMITLGGRW